ncbi:hypothetical protein [Sunxiuqinia dokdonensis]|uniref:Uncharacterized protein n=1 Tax=Sunxiuqinia dokdonensis TaxID=1409788 RepID=A0A0L8V7W3_9BACT|nr:hypothetical protein [Sunxiuqinia dokdonensis]KOH44575.1 hypothetical protein NC99_25600 [Sunxiuqinia dokdonensis]
MFGIDQISWGQFGTFILIFLGLWYLWVILMAIAHQTGLSRNTLFEEDQASSFAKEDFKPIAVCSWDFPSQLMPFAHETAIPLPVSFYEETGLDEGYAIDRFASPNDPHLPAILEQVQYQQ